MKYRLPKINYYNENRRNLKMQGTVKWFNNQKGYGFITDSEGKDVFVHYNNIVMDGFRYLVKDDIVDFELGSGNDGRQQAVNVKLIVSIEVLKNALKEDNLYIQTMKDSYDVIKYQVVNQNNVLQSSEEGMTLFELATYAGFEIHQLSA